MQEKFRSIPSIDICIRALRNADVALANAPQTLLRQLVQDFWAEKRLAIRQNSCDEPLDLAAQMPALQAYARAGLRPRLRRVLNATGVVIHTNLGRSLLVEEAATAAFMAASSYCNLEMDLATGERGSRHDITETLICQLTGAEAGMVVNNNAAAVLLILDSLCAGGEVIVSRGELVEIGGSFRIPDIMTKSGAALREVGTTNRTHLRDYAAAINENTRAILAVHTSNFRVIGFHKSVPLADLRQLCDEHSLPLLFDLGSGSLLDFSGQNLPPEPIVSRIIADGADCVSFSGDKCLGGPQAGIIAGKKEYVDKCKKNPLTRALRCDKLCIAALEATLRVYLDPELARTTVPTPRMIGMDAQALKRAASSLATRIRKSGAPVIVSLRDDNSRVGGGAYPECPLPTTLVCLEPKGRTAQSLRDALLNTDPPLIGRLEGDAFCLDPRTLLPRQYAEVVKVIANALNSIQS